MRERSVSKCLLRIFAWLRRLAFSAEYYRAITDGSTLPLIIYNVMPTAEAAVESLEQLMVDNPAIVGVKQSARNMHTLAALLATMRGKVKLFSAIDDMIYPSFVLGVDGTISGTSAVFPRESVELFEAVRAGDHDRALRLHRKNRTCLAGNRSS